MRKASEIDRDKFPYNVYCNPLNIYFASYAGGEIKILGRYKSDLSDNLSIMRDVEAGKATMYVGWVGRYSTEMFIVDTIHDMIEANTK